MMLLHTNIVKQNFQWKSFCEILLEPEIEDERHRSEEIQKEEKTSEVVVLSECVHNDFEQEDHYQCTLKTNTNQYKIKIHS